METHLIDGEVLDQNTIARQAYSSPDNFRKVFHLITGYTIGEYIRNRRLSLAGEELISSNRTVTDIALEYGYDTPESFTKAFTRFHGNSPTYVRNNKSGLHNFTRIVLRVTADGGSMLNYRIVKINNMCIAGYSRVFTSLDTAKNNVLIPKFTRECCSQSWDKLMEIKSTDEKPNNCLFGYRSNDFINIDKFNNEISCFNYTFGRMITKQEISGLNISDYSITNIPDGEFMSTYEEEYYSRTQTLNANVYVTVGANEDKNFISSIEDFYNDLQERNYTGLNLTYEKIEGYDHNTVFKPSIKNTLLMFYKKDSE